VWEGDWSGSRVVVKVLRKLGSTLGRESIRAFLGEVEIWSQLRHPHICSFLGTTMHAGRPAIVLEYMRGGSLHDLLHQNGPDRFRKPRAAPLAAKLLARILVEVSSGIAYLHSNKVTHREIWPGRPKA